MTTNETIFATGNAEPEAPGPAAAPVMTADPADHTNPALATTDPVPEDCRGAPPRDDGANLTGYYRRPADETNHRAVIAGDAEPWAIAARERNGFEFLGYRPE